MMKRIFVDDGGGGGGGQDSNCAFFVVPFSFVADM